MLTRYLIIIFLTTIFIYPSKADSNQHVKFTLNPSALKVQKGEEIKLKLDMDIDKYWYTYSMKEQINKLGIGPTPLELVPDTNYFKTNMDKILTTKPKVKYDEGFEMKIQIFKDKPSFLIPVTAKKDINFDTDSITLEVYIQQCDTVRCLPPESYFVKIGNIIFSEEEVADMFLHEKETVVTSAAGEFEEVKSKGIFSFLWFAMSMGALALLTPCVFPMIPITVSFFTKRAEKEKSKGIRDAFIFAFGIIFTFSALGFILALIYGASGIQDFATNPWINLFIAVIFIVFALNLFGAFEIQVPTGIMNKLNVKAQSGTGITSVFLMGLVFSLTSFTCTVPFVGTSLASASGGEWFYPIIGMIGFSAVLAFPFFLLAIFPSAMKALPKSGGWMNNVKVVMGFLEIAAAMKFISNADLVWAWGIMPREIFLAIWVGCTVLITVYILGVFKLSHDTKVEGVSSLRIIFAIFFAALTLYLYTGLMGKKLGELDAFLPPPDYETIISGGESSEPISNSNSEEKQKELSWYSNLKKAIDIAKTENKNIFIDFTGFTCTNCRWMEQNMFTKPKVKSRLENFIRVRLYTDRKTEPYISNKKFQQERFNSIEQPLHVIMTPDEKVLGTKNFTRDVNDYIAFLKLGAEE